MADTPSKIDLAAQKAFADAAAKKSDGPLAKPVVAPLAKAPKAPEAVAKELVAQISPASETKKPAPKKFNARKAMKKVAAAKPLAAPAAAPLASAPAALEAAPAAPTSTPINPIRQLKDKIMATAPNTNEYTAKLTDAAAEMQSRAKAAFEKGSELTADMTAFHKGNFEALVESGKVLASTMQDLGRTAVEEARTAAETVTADVKALAAVKSPTELFQLQGEIARRNLDAIVARTSKNAEVMMKLANDMFAPISTRASVAMERLNKAA